MKKIEARKLYKNIRQNVLNKDNKTKSINKILFELDEFKRAQTIFSYNSTQSEVCTDQLNLEILRQGKTLALPKTYGEDMKFRQVCNLNFDLEKGSFSIFEPLESLKEIKMADIIIVPAIAFSNDLNRVGYGAGFYDRFLCDKDIFKIGIAFSDCICDDVLFDEFDIKMDMVITENSNLLG